VDLLQSLPTQVRVIKALMLREMLTRFSNLGAGYLWAFIPPLAQVATLYLVWTMLTGGRDSADMPLSLFLITGVLPFWLFRQSMQPGLKAVKASRGMLTFPQVTLFDIIFSNVILEYLTNFIVFVTAVVGARFLGDYVPIQDPLGLLVGFFLMCAAGTGVGMVVGGISTRIPSAPQIAQFVLVRPLFFTSGLFFTVEMLNPSVQKWLLFNPLLHAIEFIRSSYFYSVNSSFYDLGYVSVFVLFLITVGYAMLLVGGVDSGGK
jgi:capsular polysaccharide transport system permease protein